jgi:regulatory protein
MAKDDSESIEEILFPSSYTVLKTAYSSSGESVKLTLSGEETLVLPADKYALSKLREGSELSREELLELKRLEALFAARRKALKILERRPYTAAQLKLKLAEALVSREIIAELLADFHERGLIDDGKFAEAWIAEQLKRKPQGRRLLLAGLLRKGVSRVEAARLIAEAYPAELEEEQCAAFMKKLIGRRGLEADELLPALARRGFDVNLVKKVYRRLKKPE